jgi:hypothetical protein
MSVVLEFKSKEGLNAERQIQVFIDYAKSLTAFDRPDMPLDWDANNWAPWKTARCGLCTFLKAGVSAVKARPSQASEEYFLEPEIRDFAKAYIRYNLARQPKKNAVEIMALRAVEKALLDLKGRALIQSVDENVLSQAAILAQEIYPGSCYQVGGQLERLARFLTDKQMIERPLIWRNPIERKRDVSTGHRSKKAEAAEKMPDERVLDALAEIFALKPTAHRDIVATSMVGILVSAPSRISELLELPANCVLKEWNRTDEKEELMLRFHAKKGGGFMKKVIPQVIADTTEEAITRLLEITEEPRKLARFLEDHPDEFPPHERLPQTGQDDILSPEQAADALCLSYNSKAGSKRTNLRMWLKTRLETAQDKFERDPSYEEVVSILSEALGGMPPLKKAAAANAPDTYTLTLRKLNTVCRKLYLPDHFPYTTPDKITKHSDALLCFFYNQLNTQFDSVKPWALQNFTKNWLNNYIGASDVRAKLGGESIFERWGYRGESYRISSHQFRHYLNTLAHRGQAGELEIARWSGRANLSDNAAYNHMGEEEYVDRMRALGVGENSKAELIFKSKKNMPITLAELEAEGDRVAHVTLYGACVHDFSMEPCQLHRDCISCREHRCIKGDDEKLKRIKKLKSMNEVQLTNALEGLENGYMGTDRWVQFYSAKLGRANQLIDILENPDIEDGAVIHMGVDVSFSPIKRVLAEQSQDESRQLSTSQKDSEQVESLRKLLGR